MNSDPASLANLRELAVPPPVSWWPLAIGWWIVLGAIAVATTVVLHRAWRAWRANAYRRAALRELDSATNVSEIAAILKRVALAAYPRTDVAALSGIAWADWLGRTGGQQVSALVAEALTRGVFDAVDTVNVGEVSAFAADWIRQHDVRTRDRKERNER